MTRRRLLEIAVSTPDEAVVAAQAGADRLELSSGLEIGGLTPSLGLFRAVRDAVCIPVWVMLRSCTGVHFHYARQLAAMQTDLSIFLAEGAAGIVFGLLTERGEIDRQRCRELVQLAQGRAVFNRAFDFLPDPFAAIDELVQLGFARILTSGGVGTAQADPVRLAKLVQYAAGRIEILAAGGIRPPNVADIIRISGCTQVHSSARIHSSTRNLMVPMTSTANPSLAATMGTSNFTCGATVQALRTELDQLAGPLS